MTPAGRFRGHQRCSRIDYSNPHHVFLVTVCVNPRRDVFVTQERNLRVLVELEDAQRQGRMGVFAYCIMPDHIHLLVNPGDPGLPAAMRYFKGRLAAWWRRNGDGQTLWQDGYSDHRLRSDESFEEKCAYIFANPVRRGLVRAASEYRWSGSLCAR